jgi:hypothetical protein
MHSGLAVPERFNHPPKTSMETPSRGMRGPPPPQCSSQYLYAFGMLNSHHAITLALLLISAHAPAPGFQAFVSERKLSQHLSLLFKSRLVPRPVPPSAHVTQTALISTPPSPLTRGCMHGQLRPRNVQPQGRQPEPQSSVSHLKSLATEERIAL